MFLFWLIYLKKTFWLRLYRFCGGAEFEADPRNDVTVSKNASVGPGEIFLLQIKSMKTPVKVQITCSEIIWSRFYI